MPTKPTEVRDGMPERLRAAADAVAEAEESLKLKRKLRDRLIVQAVDDGSLSQRAIAAAARMTVARVWKILGTSQNDDDE